MAQNKKNATTTSKEATIQAAAGKPGTAIPTEATDNAHGDNAGTKAATSGAEHFSKSNQQGNIDISRVVKRLQEAYAATPEKLDKLTKAEELHTQVLSDLDNRITSINFSLSPGQDAIAKGLAKRLTPVEKNKLRHQRTQLQSMRRKLTNSNRIISKSLIKKAKNEGKAIRLDDLRDAVKNPYYHKKYGKFIVPSFENWLGIPMTQDLHDKLVQVRSIRTADYTDALAKLLLMENPALYIKSTSDKVLKAEYFRAFRRALTQWQPRNATIKEQH
ncbi:MAG: hypothetical protein P4L63_03730 [Candidatus Pacebacteria bacterium]|nr:hypothetical protein [Candidatus Paceibacterota bacterium]